MSEPRKSFGLSFWLLLLCGPLLSFGYVLLIGHSVALDALLRFPLLLLPWPNDPGVKVVVLLNAAIWGFGLTCILLGLGRLLLAQLRRAARQRN